MYLLLKYMIFYQGGKKLERARDLFEQCLDGCPPKFAKGNTSFHGSLPLNLQQGKPLNFTLCFSSAFYLLYAKREEDHGLARHAMSVYDRATIAVLPEEQYEVPQLFPS